MFLYSLEFCEYWYVIYDNYGIVKIFCNVVIFLLFVLESFVGIGLGFDLVWGVLYLSEFLFVFDNFIWIYISVFVVSKD